MSSSARFAAIPRHEVGVLSAAQTTRDNPSSNVVTVLTAGANGSKVERVVIQALGTTTAGMVRLYISDGTTHRLLREVPVAAVTPSGTVAAFTATLDLTPAAEIVVIPAGKSLRATTHNAESFAVHAFAGDFGAVAA